MEKLLQGQGPWFPLGLDFKFAVISQGNLLFCQSSAPVANRRGRQTKGVRMKLVAEGLREGPYDRAFGKSVTGPAPPDIVRLRASVQ
eukprot:6480134-Amphidinium_carterae.1